MSILGKVLLPIGEEKAEVLNSSDASKRQKLCAQGTGEDEVKTGLQGTGNFLKSIFTGLSFLFFS